MGKKNAHCSYCGEAFPADLAWPRTCSACGETSFINPTPVAVVVLPVDDGVMVIRRGIEPHLGSLALPGGFVDFGETWQAAAARELFEETGITIPEESISLLATENARGVILLFGLATPLEEASLPDFTPTPETTERVILRAPKTLAFPLHTRILADYFAQRAAKSES